MDNVEKRCTVLKIFYSPVKKLSGGTFYFEWARFNLLFIQLRVKLHCNFCWTKYQPINQESLYRNYYVILQILIGVGFHNFNLKRMHSLKKKSSAMYDVMEFIQIFFLNSQIGRTAKC